jgi:pullulanase/glycogen debranching enzyme
LGLIEKLDYLKSLGVNAIELLPVRCISRQLQLLSMLNPANAALQRQAHAHMHQLGRTPQIQLM